jgi:dolichyl-phosphate-mannose-protein mannosyltransferase
MDQTKYLESRGTTVKLGWRAALAPLAALAFFAAGLWNLAGPAMWWDEGWTLSVARNWVERGHYGRLFEGRLATNGLEASLPVTGSVALGFRLFGVGIWQGRLPGVVAMVAALALMYFLAARLYNRRVAIGTMGVLLLMPMHPQLHPLVMGRQVLGEMHMFCFLLAGYAALLLAFNRSRWWIVAALCCWGLAIVTKAQVLPFWAASLAVPLAVALFGRRWREAGLLGVGLGGGYSVARYVLPPLFGLILRGQQAPDAVTLGTVQGLYEVTAFVTTAFNRLFALQLVLLAGLPAVFGLCYATWRAWQTIRQPAPAREDAARDTLRLALLSLAGSWFAWFLLLSVGVPRYLFPATFFASIFTAALLHDLTDGFDLPAVLSRAGTALRRLRLDRKSAGALLAILMFVATVPITLLTINRYYLNDTDRSATRVADFFNTQTSPDVLVETYESELHFLLNRRYHYPPDQIHVLLNHRSLLQEQVTIDYDPLAADPDYLVVGRFSRENKLYEPVIASGAFRLLYKDGLYDVYKRAR